MVFNRSGKKPHGLFQPVISDEDVHFAVEKKLIDLIGPIGKKLHTGRSRNDQVGTDLRLWLRKRIDEIDMNLERLQVSLFLLAEQNLHTLIPGYTHLQRAQPLSLAHHLLAYVEMAQRDRNRLKDVRKRVNISPLGAAALAGTSISINRQITGSELDFQDIYSNSLDAVSDRDFVVEFLGASALIMAHLSRLSEEVIFLLIEIDVPAKAAAPSGEIFTRFLTSFNLFLSLCAISIYANK